MLTDDDELLITALGPAGSNAGFRAVTERSVQSEPSLAQIAMISRTKKTGLPASRQPGYLLKTRGFPSPPHGGFGFSGNIYLSLTSKSVKVF